MNFKSITSFVLLVLTGINIFIGDIFVYALSPGDLTNKVFFFDAQDTDNDGIDTNEPSNNSQITNLIDKFNTNTGSQITSAKQPLYLTNSINNYPSIFFDGSDDLLDIKDNLSISLSNQYDEKSYAMIIKTSDDITAFQTIYDESTKEKGFSFQIEGGKLYAGAFNTIDWSAGEEYKIIDMGDIETDTVYTVIYSFDQPNDSIIAYLNGELKNTLNSISSQTTHGACTFETAFNCNIYSSGGTLGIGSTKNDTLRLSNTTESEIYEGNQFKGYIGEISSYNYALTSSESIEINDYLFQKWGVDLIAPTITSTNFLSGSIIPGADQNIIFDYNDTHTGSLGIDNTTANLILEKWNGSTWVDTTSTYVGTDITNATGSSFPLTNLDFGKYKSIFNISDLAGNISNDFEATFYVDKPELTVSSGSVYINNLNSVSNSFAGDITVTVKTIGAPFKVILKKNAALTNDSSPSDFIPYHDSSLGFGFDKNFDGSIVDISTNEVIGQEVLNINTSGDLNSYSYTVKLGAIIDQLQSGGNYTGSIDFDIQFDY